MNFEERFAAFIASRAGTAAIAGWGIAAMIAAGALSSGPGFLNLLLACALAIATVWLDTAYTITRSRATSFAALLPLMLAGDPAMAERVNRGTVMAMCLIGALAIFMGVYNTPRNTRRVFLAFLTVAVTAVFIPKANVFLAVFAIGLGQMHIFKLRPLLAGILAAITPPWILWGFGLPLSIDMPAPAALTALHPDHSLLLRFTIIASATALAGILLSVTNMTRIMSYNSRSRGNNGLLLITALAATIMAAVSYPDLGTWLPTLFLCLTFQTGHFTVINETRRWSCFTIPAMGLAYTILAIWTHLP